LSVPEDVSVVGFDGIVEGALSVPSLTTVAQPIPTMGADVATFLLDGSLQISAPAVHREYDLELLCRESTQPPRTRP
jgi:DNA-binding LacI/PurR family transcriptional regulator